MQRIQLKDKTFKQITYYKTGSGPAVLLVHGFPANVHLWRHVIPELSAKYTLLLPAFFEEENDWMEHGATATSKLADAFNDILEQEQIHKALLIGHSMGGYMGLEFAAKYSSKLVGLSLVHSSPLGDDSARAEGRRKTVSILENGGKSPFLKKMVRALFPDAFNLAHPEVYLRQTEEAIAVNDQSLVAFYRAIMERRATSEIVERANFPMQTIVGKKDTLANITKELASENLASTNFVHIYENEAHMAMLECPSRLSKDLLQFAAYAWSK